MDCNFDEGTCEWVQDTDDDVDWSVAYHDDGNRVINIFHKLHFDCFILFIYIIPRTYLGAEYYMALSGLMGEQEDRAKLKLLLSDRVQQGSFCLTFNYRVVGRNVGTLKVLLDNNTYPVWGQSQSTRQSWQTELLTVAWKDKAPEAVSHL